MSAHNSSVMQPYVTRLWPALQWPHCARDIAFTFSSVAAEHPQTFLPRLEEILAIATKYPDAAPAMSALVARVGLFSRSYGDTCAENVMKLLNGTANPEFQVSILEDMRLLHKAHPGLLAPLVHRIQTLAMSDSNTVRHAAYSLCLEEASASVIRVALTHPAPPGTRHCAFGTFFCRTSTPWESYFEAEEELRGVSMPLVLMIVRFDGRLGFAGGHVEQGETPAMALTRELRDELNWEEDTTLFEHVCSHHILSMKLRSHFYAREVSYADLKEIERRVVMAPHFGAEVMGLFRAPICAGQGKGHGLEMFLRHNFPLGVIHELITLIVKQDLLPKQAVVDGLLGAGLDPGIGYPEPFGGENEEAG
eukprot:CAMPEP_0175924738 /NCGR_PEP_ID=MMETSP0108-20121206/15275_1 /TAXON_ID=195067 ORGANISM="Goniomonas pacifica, Strain CCMP1869" /NCGR_SAMPLE_ID=MMETSP0108 /ASSEMBLY_ACC=CAM_ASM_000204 /LENGTH=363 /DNA_ID=CAMNT_0017247847 /DNA_START=45 /DNA_END=1132 /DNA_ORIENTATION=-